MIVTTDAIVLHSRRYGDTSRISVLLSRDLGKVSVVARGARTPKSPFGSTLEPLSRIRATIYHRKNRDLHTISGAESLVPGAWGDSYDRLRNGLGLCELILRTQADESPAPEIFDLLDEALRALRSAPEAHGVATSLRFRLQLADVMGFGLPLAEIAQGVAVNVSLDDGLARSESASGVRLSASAYRLLSTVLERTDLDIPSADRLELESFLQLYFSHHLDRRITSRVTDTLG